MPLEFYLPSGPIGPIGPDPRLENRVIDMPDSGGNKNCRHQIFFKIQVSTLVKNFLSRLKCPCSNSKHLFLNKDRSVQEKLVKFSN